MILSPRQHPLSAHGVGGGARFRRRQTAASTTQRPIEIPPIKSTRWSRVSTENPAKRHLWMTLGLNGLDFLVACSFPASSGPCRGRSTVCHVFDALLAGPSRTVCRTSNLRFPILYCVKKSKVTSRSHCRFIEVVRILGLDLLGKLTFGGTRFQDIFRRCYSVM